ncbi:hypothetical protein HJC23_012639 [Cyclotella cryptica]|uniref:Uncharacterized protein n=1 Tax=Cyclotella cryptica TaxID=29204 RepID=A0ABD3QMJ9_9STRA
MPKTKKVTFTSKVSPRDIHHVDPARIRYQHSRMRPHFNLPLIQVPVGPDENDGMGPWYFLLNNQRLWVWKRLWEEGLQESGVVPVRGREAKNRGERERYTLENCVVGAKIIWERSGRGIKSLKREEGETTAEELVKYVVSDPSEVEVDRKIVDSDDESMKAKKRCRIPIHSVPS